MTQYAVNLEIKSRQFDGKTCFQLGKKGPLLVTRENAGKPWRLVEELPAELTHTDLVGSYGCWTDRELSSGPFFWKTVERPKDGIIQPDEVESFAVRVAFSWEIHDGYDSRRLPRIQHMSLFSSPSGEAMLQEIWQRS